MHLKDEHEDVIVSWQRPNRVSHGLTSTSTPSSKLTATITTTLSSVTYGPYAAQANKCPLETKRESSFVYTAHAFITILREATHHLTPFLQYTFPISYCISSSPPLMSSLGITCH